MRTRKNRKYKTKKSKGGMMSVMNRLRSRTPPAVISPLHVESPAQASPSFASRVSSLVSRAPVSIEALIESTSGNKAFMKLCAKHIMVTNLDCVQHVTWLNNNDNGCNIFLIGERHFKHTRCASIYTMLMSLDEEIEEESQDSSESIIDLMIEYSQADVMRVSYKDTSSIEYNSEKKQIDNVRNAYRRCIEQKNCKLRVHWTDPTITNYKDKSKNIEKWITDLYKYNMFSNEWAIDPDIRRHIRVEADIIKLLTHNQRVVKEIEKASEVNPVFTLELVKDIFLQIYRQLKRSFWDRYWKSLVIMMLRHVVDLYFIARIIKLKMKNVIFYGGDSHTNNIIYVLSLPVFNFKKIKVIKGKCP